MAKAAIEVRPIAGAIGAEIHGVDLARALDDATVAAIRKAWLDHNVIFFRDQELPPARFLTFARQFGQVDRVSLREGARGIPRDHPGRQARAREDQLRRHLALRHLLPGGAADGHHAGRARGAAVRRRHHVRQHVSGLRGPLRRHEAAARRAHRHQHLGQGRRQPHARGPRAPEHARRRQEGVRRRAPGGAHAS